MNAIFWITRLIKNEYLLSLKHIFDHRTPLIFHVTFWALLTFTQPSLKLALNMGKPLNIPLLFVKGYKSFFVVSKYRGVITSSAWH